MDLSDILANLDKALGIVGILVGFGGVWARYLMKAKVTEILGGAKDLVDLVDSYDKYGADQVWTDEEYKNIGKKGVAVVERVKPLVGKLVK